MDTAEINHVLNNIGRLFKERYGERLVYYVCACDRLPLRLPAHNTTVIVVNTDRANQPGKHWQAIWIRPKAGGGKRIATFFDSYGLFSTNTYINEFLRRFCNLTECNWMRLQSFNSTVCGEYCCFFILAMMFTKRLKCVLSPFNHNYENNDKTVCSFIGQTLKQSNSKKRHFCIQLCKSRYCV